MVIGRLLNKVINIFTGTFAIITLVLMLVWFVNHALGGVILSDSALVTVERLRNYFTLGTVFCAGTEFTLKRSVVVAAIFALVVAAVAAFMIYGDVAI